MTQASILGDCLECEIITIPSDTNEIITIMSLGPPGPIGPQGPPISGLKAGLVNSTSFVGSPKKYTVLFATAYADDNYTIAISGIDARSWSYESKDTTGFTINANANTALTGEVSWSTLRVGET